MNEKSLSGATPSMSMTVIPLWQGMNNKKCTQPKSCNSGGCEFHTSSMKRPFPHSYTSSGCAAAGCQIKAGIIYMSNPFSSLPSPAQPPHPGRVFVMNNGMTLGLANNFSRGFLGAETTKCHYYADSLLG